MKQKEFMKVLESLIRVYFLGKLLEVSNANDVNIEVINKLLIERKEVRFKKDSALG